MHIIKGVVYRVKDDMTLAQSDKAGKLFAKVRTAQVMAAKNSQLILTTGKGLENFVDNVIDDLVELLETILEPVSGSWNIRYYIIRLLNAIPSVHLRISDFRLMKESESTAAILEYLKKKAERTASIYRRLDLLTSEEPLS